MRRKSRSASKPAQQRELPSKEDILAFVKNAPQKVGKREIARAFGLKGDKRIELKRLLSEMSEEGLLSGNRKRLKQKGGLPAVAALEVVGRDDDGDLVASPVEWEDRDSAPPRVLLLPFRQRTADGETTIGIGDRVLARITPLEGRDIEGYRFEAEPIRILPPDKRRLLGIFRARANGGGSIAPIDRKALREWPVLAGEECGATPGDLVRYALERKGRLSVPQARVVETLGNPEEQHKVSLIAVHAHGLPDEFPDSVVRDAEAPAPADVRGRTDLRQTPLLTIDPADARDHDDAVHAALDPDPANRGGWIVTVAIADVAHYVRPGTRLDREAALRGNSVYFPDRVVPMLPERLSNDLCSLREGEDRACIAVHMVFDRSGQKRKQVFMRALMRSTAKLSYEEAQRAFDGQPSPRCAPLMRTALEPLWRAYTVLAAARDRRQPLDLNLPERKIILDSRGRVDRVAVPQRLEAHRLIEEFMIQANVAAAEALEARKAPVVYRAHAEPSKEKLDSLRDFLETLDLKLPGAGSLRPEHFNRVLTTTKALPVAELVSEVVLRSQAQAEYATENVGHFGLNLKRYAHFTSPIRRYADLLVHRSLVRAFALGEGGLADAEIAALPATAKSISEAERRGMAAERETADRLIAAYLADRVGVQFSGRISGVTRSGLFVRLTETGADGFVPISSIGRETGEFYRHEEAAHAMVGQRSGLTFRLGDTVEVRLVEAIPSAGALRFEMISEGGKAHAALAKGHRGLRNRRSRQQWRLPRR